MAESWADNFYALMGQGKYYSLQDLANLTGQPRGITAEVVEFLTKYGFIKRLGGTEPLFTKSLENFSPGELVENLERARVRIE